MQEGSFNTDKQYQVYSTAAWYIKDKLYKELYIAS